MARSWAPATFPPPDGLVDPCSYGVGPVRHRRHALRRCPRRDQVLTIDPRRRRWATDTCSRHFPVRRWSTEYGLRLGSAEASRYLITFGSGAVSRIDFPPGHDAHGRTLSGFGELARRPEGESARRRPRSVSRRRGVAASRHLLLRRRFRLGVRTRCLDRGEDAATLRSTDRCDRSARAQTSISSELLASSYSKTRSHGGDSTGAVRSSV